MCSGGVPIIVSSLSSAVGVAVAVSIAVAVTVGSGVSVDIGVTVGVTVGMGVNVEVGTGIAIVGMGVRVLVSVDVVVGVAVGVGMSIVADTGDCAVGVSVGLAVLVAVGAGGTTGAATDSDIRVAVTNGSTLGVIVTTRSARASTFTGVGAGVIIPCCRGSMNLVNTSFLADSTAAAATIAPTSTANAPIRQGRWRRRTARQWLPPLGRRRWV